MFGLDVKELLLLGVVAVMLFGRRLPEVGARAAIGGPWFYLRLGRRDSLPA